MARVVPGYGIFDPDLPTWLELRPDGRLYNRNATDQTKAWVPPDGWTGGPGLRFTPEAVPQPPEPLPPEPPPAEPLPPVTPTLPADRALIVQLIKSMRALVAHDNLMLINARARLDSDAASMREGLRLAAEVGDAFDSLLEDLLSKYNSQ